MLLRQTLLFLYFTFLSILFLLLASGLIPCLLLYLDFFLLLSLKAGISYRLEFDGYDCLSLFFNIFELFDLIPSVLGKARYKMRADYNLRFSRITWSNVAHCLSIKFPVAGEIAFHQQRHAGRFRKLLLRPQNRSLVLLRVRFRTGY